MISGTCSGVLPHHAASAKISTVAIELVLQRQAGDMWLEARLQDTTDMRRGCCAAEFPTSSQKISRRTAQLMTFFSACLYRRIARTLCAGDAMAAGPAAAAQDAAGCYALKSGIVDLFLLPGPSQDRSQGLGNPPAK